MDFSFAEALLFSLITQLLVNFGHGQLPYSIVVDGPKYVRLQPGDPLTIKCNYTKREADGVEWIMHSNCIDWGYRTIFSGSSRLLPSWDLLGDLNMTLIPADQYRGLPSGRGTIALAIQSYYVKNPSCQPIQIACLVGADSAHNVDDRVTIESIVPLTLSSPPSEELVAKENDSVLLTCNVRGYPRPQILWKKLGPWKAVARAAFTMISSENGSAGLRAIPEAAGTYVCSGGNGLQQFTTRSVTLHVEFTTRVLKPYVTPRRAIGQKTLMRCSGSAYPPISRGFWFAGKRLLAIIEPLSRRLTPKRRGVAVITKESEISTKNERYLLLPGRTASATEFLSTLVVKTADCDYMLDYTCVLQSPTGNASTLFEIKEP